MSFIIRYWTIGEMVPTTLEPATFPTIQSAIGFLSTVDWDDDVTKVEVLRQS